MQSCMTKVSTKTNFRLTSAKRAEETRCNWYLTTSINVLSTPKSFPQQAAQPTKSTPIVAKNLSLCTRSERIVKGIKWGWQAGWSSKIYFRTSKSDWSGRAGSSNLLTAGISATRLATDGSAASGRFRFGETKSGSHPWDPHDRCGHSISTTSSDPREGRRVRLHRAAARVTRVFSVRPPQRYCQTDSSCLGRDQYGLDSLDDSDDDGPRRAIDCG